MRRLASAVAQPVARRTGAAYTATLSFAPGRPVSTSASTGGRRRRRPPLGPTPTPEAKAPPTPEVLPPGLRRLPLGESALLEVVRRGRSDGPSAAYTELLERRMLEADRSQEECAAALSTLWESLRRRSEDLVRWEAEHVAWRSEHNAWALRMRERQQAQDPSGSDCVEAEERGAPEKNCADPEPAEPPKPEISSYGCYVWGSVGGGKSLLMDLMVECSGLESSLGLRARRVHFHEFMHEVHQELHQLRQAGAEKTTQTVASRIATEVQLLAFDEFQITNISDALIVETLFDALFKGGVAVVMTSNRPPTDLYKDGLNRHLAIPQFLKLLEHRRVAVFELTAGRDFRAGLDSSAASLEASPTSASPWRDFFCKEMLGTAGAEPHLRSAFAQAAGMPHGQPADVPVAWGRKIAVCEVASGVGRFTFQQLCCHALNADDYLQLAKQFHTLLLTDVPRFSLDQHNEARRFTNLVDCLYERHARLIVSADVPPEKLLETMTVLASVTISDADSPTRSRGAAVRGGGEHATGLLGTASSDWIRHNPFSPEGLTVEQAIRSAAAPGASVKAGNDDNQDGVGVAGVMAGALGSLQESGFAARRATSRLLHMQTEEYLRAHERNRVSDFA